MDNLSIVTSCTRYGPYLPAWAASIARQDVRPGEVAIFTHGSPEDERAGSEAAAVTRAAGIPTRHEHEPTRLPLGTARNRAVALSTREWVMHLDADDELFPFAVGDIREIALTGTCDIVAAGYQRSGDLQAGPKNRKKLYQTCRNGTEVLTSPAPCSGVSPFRRSLWERSPYRPDLLGGWDTALWIGFGHLGARIRPTTRPVFLYRQHADSIFNVRRHGGFVAHLTGIALRGLRSGWSGVSVIVPRAREDGPARLAAWEFVRRRLADRHPTWEVVEGFASGGHAWNKGAAVRDGLSRAKGATVVVLDADCVVPTAALTGAVDAVLGGAPWAIPHTPVHRLSEGQTRTLFGRGHMAPLPTPPSQNLHRPVYPGFAGGGCFVVSRWGYEATGGIPVSFTGWGAEDEAVAVILDTLLGPAHRGVAPLTHLWHPPAPHRGGQAGPAYRRNRAALQGLRRAAGDPVALWALVSSGRGGVSTPYWGGQDRFSTLSARAHQARAEIERTVKSSFEERRLAAAHYANQGQTKGDAHMAGALEMRRAYARARAEQKERNALAKAEQEASAKGVLLTPEHKAVLVSEVHKRLATGRPVPDPAPTEVEVAGPSFASEQAASLAAESGLSAGDLEVVEPGPRGYTAAQVREAIRLRG